jgi:hypothetical protein
VNGNNVYISTITQGTVTLQALKMLVELIVCAQKRLPCNAERVHEAQKEMLFAFLHIYEMELENL